MKQIFLALFTFLLFIGGAVNSSPQTEHLPASALVNNMVSTARVVWFDPATNYVLSFDMFGKQSTLYGLDLDPTIDGGIMVRDLGDGTERVSIFLSTKNAICWGTAPVNGIDQPAFGRFPEEIAAGATASLGDGLLHVRFLQPTGYGLPQRFVQVSLPPRILEFVSTEIICQNGELRAASGFPDGTRGFAETTQTGTFNTGVPGGCPPEQDGSCGPAEHVYFKPNGH